jgi:hypothetical protein
MSEAPKAIPQDVWDIAEAIYRDSPRSLGVYPDMVRLSRAIMTERARCADIAKARKPLYSTTAANVVARLL